MNHRLRFRTLFALAVLTLFATPAYGGMQIAEAPLLTVAGSNGATMLELSRSDLEAMPQHTVTTTTTWTDGVQTFVGPLARDVIAAAGLDGDTARAVALNDYAVEIPTADFHRYPVILALRQNGKTMSIRDKGPMWIVYPRDDHAELQTTEQNAKWIWQLARIELR